MSISINDSIRQLNKLIYFDDHHIIHMEDDEEITVCPKSIFSAFIAFWKKDVDAPGHMLVQKINKMCQEILVSNNRFGKDFLEIFPKFKHLKQPLYLLLKKYASRSDAQTKILTEFENTLAEFFLDVEMGKKNFSLFHREVFRKQMYYTSERRFYHEILTKPGVFQSFGHLIENEKQNFIDYINRPLEKEVYQKLMRKYT